MTYISFHIELVFTVDLIRAIKALSPRQVADLLGHSTSQITELYYVKKGTARLSGITEGFEM